MSRTSTEVKKRYNDKTYSEVRAFLKKEMVEEFKAKCRENGIPIAEVIREAVEKFNGNH